MYKAFMSALSRKGSPIGLIRTRQTETAVPLVFGLSQSGATVPSGPTPG